jgi:hypothetical protein
VLLTLAQALEGDPADAVPVDDLARAKAQRLLRAKGLLRETNSRHRDD